MLEGLQPRGADAGVWDPEPWADSAGRRLPDSPANAFWLLQASPIGVLSTS
jgi:hypothetical protein